jgi:hypothetical protein
LRCAAISLLCCLAIGGYAAPAAAPVAPKGTGNLVANGSFEVPGAGGLPSSWFPRIVQTPGNVAVANQFRGGHLSPYCLMLASKAAKVIYGAYSQPIDLPAGTQELLVSFYMRTERIPQPDAYVLLFKANFAEKEWQTPYVQSEDRAIPQSPGWSLVAWRFKIVPEAKQAVLAFRGMGDGAVYIDDVALRPYPQALACDVLAPGQVTSLSGERAISVQVKPTGAGAGQLTAALQLFWKGKTWTAWQQKFEAKSGETVVKGKYAFAFDQTCRGLLTVTGPGADEVYDAQAVRVPAMLDGHLTKPAFRGTVLRGVPCPRIEAAGMVNASDAIAGRTKVAARLAGSDRTATEGAGLERPTPGTWTASVDATNLLAGKYMMHVEATVDGKMCQMDLPVVVAPESDQQVGYDDTGTVWLNGKPRLPVGVYFAMAEEDLDKAKKAGYTFSVIPWQAASTATMDHAAKLGMKVLVHSRSFEFTFWEHATGKFGKHPGLMAWHLAGKPDADLNPPDTMIEVHNKLAELDPHHPIFTSLTMPSLMSEYAPGCDVVLVWTDPIPQSGPQAVGLLVDEARAAVAPRPVWAIIQTMGHAWSWERDLGKTGEGRPPTPEEHRCMRYLALVHGARGIIDYTYVMDASQRGENWMLTRDAPQLWTEITATNKEMAWIEPMVAGREWNPVELRVTQPVHVAYWKGKDFVLAMAVNTTGEKAACGFHMPPVAGAMLTDVLSGEKVVGTAGGDFGMQLEPYGVAVLAGRLAAAGK